MLSCGHLLTQDDADHLECIIGYATSLYLVMIGYRKCLLVGSLEREGVRGAHHCKKHACRGVNSLYSALGLSKECSILYKSTVWPNRHAYSMRMRRAERGRVYWCDTIRTLHGGGLFKTKNGLF